MILVPTQEWQAQRAAHEARADALTADHRARRARGERHPVWDFLYTYYPVSPSHLRRWHPGAGSGVILDSPERPWDYDARDYTTVTVNGSRVYTVDLDALWQRRHTSIAFIADLLRRTAERPPQFHCFGLHEWAMVYRDTPRHPEPLRLGAEGTNAVVDAHSLRCTHYDAFRFFTPEAAPRNATQLDRAGQPGTEQPGCLHATMDVYKWVTKLGPLIPGELLLDSFELARDVRQLDMEASPYDLRDWGFDPVPIETPAGKATYVRCQQELMARGQALRQRVLAILDTAYGSRNDWPGSS